MGPDEEGKALATPEYWDSRYAQSDGEHPTHEWFRSFEALEPFFKDNLFATKPAETNPRVLHLGSGDSTIPADLAARGYTNQLCVDFSHTAVDLMRARHAAHDGIAWHWADVRDLNKEEKDLVPSGSIDVAFDKGTLDAMIHGSPWSPPDQVLSDTSRYMREVHRALKPDGVFLYVTFRQPHFIKPLLQVGTDGEELWDLTMITLGDGASSFDYFGFVLRRK